MKARDKQLYEWLGKRVHIQVDRPIGYLHNGTRYPVNYGCIPGVIAGDGDEQDVYILGVKEPVSAFDGRVIGAIRRHNDCEDKLVAAPEGMVFHQGEIAEATAFQEQYFNSSVISLFRKSCGVIPYRQIGKEKEFLVLLQTNGCWSFPKGHIDAGETETHTALRELAEETGLEASLVPGARTVCEYDIPPLARKQVVLFLGEVHGEAATQEREIVDYRWVRQDELRDYLHPDMYQACAPLLETL